jgi:hypothetical protein
MKIFQHKQGASVLACRGIVLASLLLEEKRNGGTIVRADRNSLALDCDCSWRPLLDPVRTARTSSRGPFIHVSGYFFAIQKYNRHEAEQYALTGKETI